MQIQLRKIFSPDAIDLDHYVPDNPDNFGILVQALIGPKESQGEESFDFMLCTPKWLIHEVEKDKFVFGKGLLIMERFDFRFLYKVIDDLCQRVSGDIGRPLRISLVVMELGNLKIIENLKY